MQQIKLLTVFVLQQVFCGFSGTPPQCTFFDQYYHQKGNTKNKSEKLTTDECAKKRQARREQQSKNK